VGVSRPHECPWEAHLQRTLDAYANSSKRVETQLTLDKNAPVRRPVRSLGLIHAQPILVGLHHQYVRMELMEGRGRLTVRAAAVADSQARLAPTWKRQSSSLFHGERGTVVL
jgi:hypothetical protein